MKTYKVQISSNTVGKDVYKATVNLSHIQGESAVTEVMEEIVTSNLDDVCDFLAGKGVDRREIEFGIDLAETEGHNFLSFGAFGSFITSWFEGYAQ